jgi:hypothetical protein
VRRATRVEAGSPGGWSPLILVMSLTESALDVEGLASDRAGSGWSYDIESAAAAERSSGSAGPVTEVIGIVQGPARGKRAPRACGERASSIDARPRGEPITATTSARNEPRV